MTHPTPHGQVPEALRLAHIFDNPLPPEWPDMVAAAAELRRQHARIAELEAQIKALSGVQALSAAPSVLSDEAILNRTGCIDYSPGTAGYDLELIRWYRTQIASPAPQQSRPLSHPNREFPGSAKGAAITSESPTPPAEQQAAPKAAPGEPPGIQALMCVISSLHSLRDTAHFSDEEGELTNDLCTLRDWAYAQTAAFQPSPKAVPGEQNTVPAEWLEQAYREGWAACRDAETIGEEAEDWAFGNSTANSRMIDAQQAAPKQGAQEPTTVDKKTMELAESVGLIGPASRVGDLHAAIQRFHDLICVNATIKAAVMAAEAIGKQQAAPQQEAQEPAFWMNEKGHTWSHSDWKQFPKHRAKYPIPLYPHFPTPQPAPDCHHRPPCDECAAIAAQGGKV